MLHVAEHYPNFNYQKIIAHLNITQSQKVHLTKNKMQKICSVASSESEQKLIKYVAVKAQNLSRNQSRHELYIDKPKELIQKMGSEITQQARGHKRCSLAFGSCKGLCRG